MQQRAEISFPYRVLLALRSRLLIEGIQSYFEQVSDLTVSRRATDVAGLLRALGTSAADIALVDLSLPGLSDDIVSKILERGSGAAIVVLSDPHDPASMARVDNFDIPWVVYWNDSEKRAASVIRLAGRERSGFLDVTERRLRPAPNDIRRLTARENEILALLALNLRDADIADRLGIGSQTVHSHMSRLFGKLDVSNRTGAVLAGIRLGLISIGDAPPKGHPTE